MLKEDLISEEDFKAAEERLIELRSLAVQLRFWDDVKFHQEALNKLRRDRIAQNRKEQNG